MTKTDIQILRGARELIADELDWTQGRSPAITEASRAR